METLAIVKLGNPLLREVSTPIESNEYGTEALHQLTELLFKKMEEEQGIGLAAPQIGIRRRAVVFGMKTHPVYQDIEEIPYTVLFNPSFLPLSNEKHSAYEGCLSVPGIRAKVERYTHILYRGYDIRGQLIEKEVKNLHARVVQHELDHLDGIVFLDRVTDHQSVGFHEELVKAGQVTVRKTS